MSVGPCRVLVADEKHWSLHRRIYSMLFFLFFLLIAYHPGSSRCHPAAVSTFVIVAVDHGDSGGSLPFSTSCCADTVDKMPTLALSFPLPTTFLILSWCTRLRTRVHGSFRQWLRTYPVRECRPRPSLRPSTTTDAAQPPVISSKQELPYASSTNKAPHPSPQSGLPARLLTQVPDGQADELAPVLSSVGDL